MKIVQHDKFERRRNTFTTVRFSFPFVMVTALFAGLASVVTEQNSYLTISASETTVAYEQEFFITVSATTHVAVNAVDVVIAYPKNSLEVVGIDTGMSVITLWTEKPYAEDGKIYLRGGTYRKGFVGEHTIARVKVRAKESGDARVYISDSTLVAGDGKGTNVAQSGGEREVKIGVLGADGTIVGEATVQVVTDTNGDGTVDLKDISIFMSAWFDRSRTFDFNGDGRMNFIDFSILLANSFTK